MYRNGTNRKTRIRKRKFFKIFLFYFLSFCLCHFCTFVFFKVSDMFIFLSTYCLFYLKSFAKFSFARVSFDLNIFEQSRSRAKIFRALFEPSKYRAKNFRANFESSNIEHLNFRAERVNARACNGSLTSLVPTNGET